MAQLLIPYFSRLKKRAPKKMRQVLIAPHFFQIGRHGGITMIETELSSQKDFESSIENGVTLVDFNATWCAPCRAQEPILDEVQKAFEGKATFIKINIDHNQKIAVKLGIQSIPTLVFFKEGKELARLIGIQDAEALDRVLTDIVK